MPNLRHDFGPMDLEIIDRVYEVGCTYIEARGLYDPDGSRGDAKKGALRKAVFACASTGPVDFDTLCDKVLASMDAPGAPKSTLWNQGRRDTR
jgi:hypothetical protein